jgi:hypothetical protein
MMANRIDNHLDKRSHDEDDASKAGNSDGRKVHLRLAANWQNARPLKMRRAVLV